MILESLRARQSFSEIAALDDAALSLDHAALTMALEEYPRLEIPEYLRKLDTLAARAEVLIGEDRAAVNVIEAINQVLFVQEGYRGNVEDYYDPRNSYLNEVLDRKLGIPITLSVLYMEVAKRIDFQIHGIGFPGHFLIKHSAGDRDIIIDPFEMGRILTLNDCQELLDKIHKGSVEMNTALLQPMSKRMILTRMLYNLKGIYTQKEQYHKALAVIDSILMLNPGTPSELRDRGLLYMQTSLFSKALADLETYLARSLAPQDSAYIQNHIRMLRSIVCATN
ncbi:MAG: transglutaminase-like domain-containing protein [Acidobacteriota bacterium]|nr:transglutaminase-like domain-containing protein [Acidobacteriota bacterium]